MSIAERVARGAALLDEKEPGWWQRINLDTLVMRSTCQCILGQLYHNKDWPRVSYADGQDALGVTGLGDEYGFDDEDHAWGRLEAAWRELIGSRRAAA